MSLAVAALVVSLATGQPMALGRATRADREGWICLKLMGSPDEIGFQHGYLLACEIVDCIALKRFELGGGKPDGAASYKSTCAAMRKSFWTKIPEDMRREIRGIAKGVRARGHPCSEDDILCINASIEWSSRQLPQQEHCSAFIATGSATKDGKIVMGHSNWAAFTAGERWNVILDMRPSKGRHFVMDAMPGMVESGDDFAINDAGILLCETTIASFKGWDERGIPEFVRMRQAIQFSRSLDDVARILRTGNNGGYANTWLIGDLAANEIGKLELGLRNVILHRTTTGAYFGANYPEDDKLVAEECEKDLRAGSNSAADRKRRWEALIAANRGRIDPSLGKSFLADHHDEVLDADGPSISTLCGHGDVEARKSHTGGLIDPPSGAVQAKVTSAAMARHLSFWARMGRPCGIPFEAKRFLRANAQYANMAPFLRDMPSRPWIVFGP